MDMDPELAREWIAAARSLQATMERLPRRADDQLAQNTNRTGDVSVNVEDGKAARMMTLALFSAVLCAVMTVITVVALLGGGMLYLNMKDHVDAIYMMAPQLNQPGEKKS